MIRFLIITLLLFSNDLSAKTSYKDKQIGCAARLIYHELRGGSDKAKMEIVLKPTLNRATDMLLGGVSAEGSKVETKRLDVCAVIKQKGQYQWVKKKLKVSEQEEWDEAKIMAKDLLSRKFYTVTGRRFFNNASLGRLHKTKSPIIELSKMVAY
jgi:hypothetical protein